MKNASTVPASPSLPVFESWHSVLSSRYYVFLVRRLHFPRNFPTKEGEKSWLRNEEIFQLFWKLVKYEGMNECRHEWTKGWMEERKSFFNCRCVVNGWCISSKSLRKLEFFFSTANLLYCSSKIGCVASVEFVQIQMYSYFTCSHFVFSWTRPILLYMLGYNWMENIENLEKWKRGKIGCRIIMTMIFFFFFWN